MPLGECSFAVRDGGQWPADIPRVPQLQRKNPPKRFDPLAEGLCARWMAGRGTAMASYVHVDLPRHRAILLGLPDFQWALQASSVCAARHSRSLADGATLFFLWPQTPGAGSLQLTSETCVHLGDHPWNFVCAHRVRRLEAGATFLAGLDDG